MGVISTVPTQCQGTPAPVTLGIRSTKMDMLVTVGVRKWLDLRFMSVHLVCKAMWAVRQFGCPVVFELLHNCSCIFFIMTLCKRTAYFTTCKTY